MHGSAHGHGHGNWNVLADHFNWGSGSGLSDSAVGGGEFGEVLLLEALNTIAAVELGAQALVLLHEARKLLRQLCVLVGEARNVCSERVALSKLVGEAVLQVHVALASALVVLLEAEELRLEAGESLLQLLDVAAGLGVAGHHAGEFLGGLCVLVGERVVVLL